MKRQLLLTVLAIFAIAGCSDRADMPAGYMEDEITGRYVVKNAWESASSEMIECQVVIPLSMYGPYAMCDDMTNWREAAAKRYQAEGTRQGALVAREEPDPYTLYLKGKNIDWVLVITAEIALDKGNVDHIKLTTPEAREALKAALGDLFRKYPDRESEEYKKESLSYGPGFTGAQIEPETIFEMTKKSDALWKGAVRYHHNAFAYSHPYKDVERVVRAWQAREGHPYTPPRDVISRVWAWNRYIAKDQINAYIQSEGQRGLRKVEAGRRRVVMFVAYDGTGIVVPPDIIASAGKL